MDLSSKCALKLEVLWFSWRESFFLQSVKRFYIHSFWILLLILTVSMLM